MSELLDAIDQNLLAVLQENSDLTAIQLSEILKAQGLHLGPAATRNRVADLKARGFIKKFSAVLDPDKFDLSHMFFVLVELGAERTDNSERVFLNKVQSLPEVLEIHEVFGEFDFLLKMRVHHLSDALSLSRELAPLVKTIRTFPVALSHKDTAVLPLALMKDTR